MRFPQAAPIIGGLSASMIAPGSPHYGRLQGLLVTDVAERSPAHVTGFRAGDIITAINDEAMLPLETFAQLTEGKLKIERVSIKREGMPYFAEGR
jgi:S1-C subfamily serine protease